MEYNLEGLSFENKIFLSMIIQFYPGDTNNIDEWITPDFVNETKAHFDSCPMCNQKIKSMHISEKVLDSKHIQNIMTESENWIN